MLNAELLKEMAKDCNTERITQNRGYGCCAGCPLGSICPHLEELGLEELAAIYKHRQKPKGDGREMKETNFIKPCSTCFRRRAPADRCYEGDPYYRCPEYLKHVEKAGD